MVAVFGVVPAWADWSGPQPVAGFGLAAKESGSGGSGALHLGIGFTLFSPDEKGIVGLAGLGFNVESYRDRWAESPYERANEIKFMLTVIPIRVGPLCYEFSWSKHVQAFGHDRGRVHVIKLDIPGFIRAVRAAP
jgi:hypothetical protein